MDDAEFDAELRAAGERFRLQHTTAADTAPMADFEVSSTGEPGWPRRRRTALIAAAAVVALLGASGWLAFGRGDAGSSGAHIEAGSSDGLDGWEWYLSTITSAGSGTGPYGSSLTVRLKGSSPTIAFGAGLVIGNDGCNGFSGPVTEGATAITFGDIATTAMGCAEPAAGSVIPASFFSGSVTWSITDNTLTLEHDGTTLTYERGGRAEFDPADASSSSSAGLDASQIQGAWQLTSYEQTSGDASGTGTASPTGFSDETLTVTDTGFTVEHRCYVNKGDVAIGSGTATWSNVHLTQAIPCPAIPTQSEDQARDQLIDSVLTGDTSWHIDSSGGLEITKGGDTLDYTPLPPTAPSGSPAVPQNSTSS